MLPTIILHGWSDNSSSFAGLAKWLQTEHGIPAIDIFLGDYLSMNDEVTLFDLGYAFDRALDKSKIPQEHHSFNVIVHSTGGLVVREYLRQKCLDHQSGRRNAKSTPIQHLCMLAPANFGSPLATLGKSILGRVFKGWKWNGFGESGQKVLDALELASPYSFDLAVDDLFDPEFPIFDPQNTLTTVMVGTTAYPGALKSTMHENGSDGTVRVATANLQASYFKIDFKDADKIPDFVEVPRNIKELALAVFHRNHGSITRPDDPTQHTEWENTLVSALTIAPSDYPQHVQRCQSLTDQTFAEGINGQNSDWYHRYQHVVFRVHDQHGAPIDDFIVEFYQEPRDPEDRVFKEINTQVLEKVTKNQRAANHRSFFFDLTDLVEYLNTPAKPVVEMSVSAAHISRRIRFRNPELGVEVFRAGNPTFIRPNQPILVDITLHRDPDTDSPDPAVNVFRLTAANNT
jgi:pimeloyl-ACP methyl ester carboxylesterase